MTAENEKMTTPVPAVGAAGEQSDNKITGNIIPKEASIFNKRKGSLNTVSMSELFDTVYPPKLEIIDGILYAGTYLFVGAPKIGKSFFMAQLSYHIASGTELWSYPVHQGEVLYLALEDDYARIQKRLYKMFGMEETNDLHFATQFRTLSGGLNEQLEEFIKEHPNTKLVIVDTLQKVREIGGDKYNYASDYEIVAKLKAFSDKHNICLLVVHHTRKMESEDSFDMISGTNGLLGAADGAFIMQKKKRTDNKATMSVVGRDQQDQELTLEFDRERCIWRLIKAEAEVWKTPPDPVLEAVSKLVTPLTPVWTGSPSQLIAYLPDVAMLSHVLTRYLNVNTERLFNEYGILFESKRTHDGRTVTLKLVNPPASRKGAFMKYVRIAEDLFCDLFLYHVIGSEEPGQRIKSELEKKMDAMLRHDYYTKYKTAPDEAAREEARRKYLDSVGIPQDFRW